MNGEITARFAATTGQFTLAVDLVLPGQGVSAIFGPSGAGKSTLLRCIAGLLRVPGGKLVVNGECWQDDQRGIDVPTHHRALGYVFQDANLFPHLSVRGNLAYGQKRVAQGERRVLWDHAVELFGVGALLDRMPAGLSGGERQRVGLARALLSSPRLLLLDEPLASLDEAKKREILPYLERLRDELAVPILYVSHAHDEVARLADHIVVLEQGRVLAQGPLIETLARLDSPIRIGEQAGAVLEGSIVERDTQWHLARFDSGAGSLWIRDSGAPTGQRLRVRILARDVSIALTRSDSSISNTLPATVVALGSDEHPALVLVRLQVGSEFILARLTARSAAQLGLVAGMNVWVQIKAVSLQF